MLSPESLGGLGSVGVSVVVIGGGQAGLAASLGPVPGVRLHGLPDYERRGQRSGPRIFLLRRPFTAHARVVAAVRSGEDAAVVAHAVARHTR
jgi:hypothetical protein